MKLFQSMVGGVRAVTAAILLAAVASAPAQPAADRDALRRQAAAALGDRLFDLAEKNYRAAAALGVSPDEKARDTIDLARTLTLAARPKDATTLLEGAARPAGGALAAEWEMERARAKLAGGEAAAALEVLAAIPAGAAEAVVSESLRLKALALFKLERFKEAREAFATLIDRGVRDETPQDLLDAAAAAERAGEPAQASRWLMDMAEKYPDHPLRREAILRWGAMKAAGGKAADIELRLRPVTEDAQASAEERARAWMILAAAYEADQSLPKALEALDRAIAAAPQGGLLQDAKLAQARLWIRTGDWDRGRTALRALLSTLATDPKAAQAQLELARYLLENKHPAEALEEFQKYLDVFDRREDRAAAMMGKAWALLGVGRAAEAADTFDRAAALMTDPMARAGAWVKAADAWFAGGQFAQALDKYMALAAQVPNYEPMADVELQIAECLRKLGRLPDAEKKYVEIARGRAGTAAATLARLGFAALAADAGRWDEAAARYGQLIALQPDESLPILRAHLGRGLALYRKDDFAGAIADFDTIIRAATPGADDVRDHATFLRIWALDQMGHRTEAVRSAREFVQRRPASTWTPQVRFWLGERAFNDGEYAQAMELFEELVVRHPQSALADRACYWAGRAAFADREFLRANEFMSRLTKAYPSSSLQAAARFLQGDALTELGQFDAALLAYDELIRQNGASALAARAWGRKGDCHFTLGADHPRRYEEALKCYETAAAHAAADAEVRLQALYKAGRALERQNLEPEALDHYQRVVYEHLDAREKGQAGAYAWFARAAFSAAAIYERQSKLNEAAGLYRRVAEAGGAAAAEARASLRRIQAEPRLSP